MRLIRFILVGWGMLAGVLMAFVRDAPSLMTGTAMPAFPMSDQDARDVTAYLVQLGAR